jgi:putative tricarboxylic transport membrane protein
LAREDREEIQMKHSLFAGLISAALALPAMAENYTIIAPASPGGGWDQTARTMQEALTADGISKSVQVQNVPGAGGTIGLAQFVAQNAGKANQLLVGGYVMVGAILTNKSPVSLNEVTPIARLIEKIKADPGAVSWAGGSAGGTDHIAVGLITKAAGVDPTRMNYIAYSGGGEALAAILGNQVTAGISSLGEFLPQAQAGTLRILAVSSEQPIAGVEAPTLKEAGLDVVLQNWRMVSAPPGISAEQKARITADIKKMAQSPSWKQQLESKGWEDTYLDGEALSAQLAEDIAQTGSILKDIGLVK